MIPYLEDLISRWDYSQRNESTTLELINALVKYGSISSITAYRTLNKTLIWYDPIEKSIIKKI